MRFSVKRMLGGLAVATLIAVGLVAAPQPSVQQAAAVTGSEFMAGNIISDDRFFDYNAMSEAQIQTFLTSMTPSCGWANGLPCLAQYVGLTSAKPNSGSNHCVGYDYEGYASAAHMIWKVAQSCKINPQVLLVMLQKEQGLVTTTSPSERQYRSAMGYACPDTADCDTQYYGFFNQLYSGTWQLRQYTNFPERRYKIGTVSIGYNPSAACGASNVNIQNQATANLYNYTPYQPNAAALANLGGSGDGCSAYGNRNFWVYFNNWFGSSTAGGAAAISALYASMGGAGGSLGAATSGIISISQNGGGSAQAFQNGSIYWTSRTGAAAVSGAFRDFYFSYGGAAGALGWPNWAYTPIPDRAGGGAQSFSEGSLYASNATGIHAVIGAMRTSYFAQGGATGALGWPTSESSAIAANGGGSGQAFENGSIYSSSAGGSRAVLTKIRDAYFAEGGAAGKFGWPQSDTLTIAGNGGGTGQVFQNGSIYSSAAGAFGVSGGVLSHYFSLGGSAGSIGWPTSSMVCATGGASCTQNFQRGTIYWTAASGGRVGLPAIETVYESMGGANGSLGARSSTLLQIDSGYGQVFANGSVYYHASTGAFAVSGAIREFYFTKGGSTGTLGWPTGAQACASGSSCSQSFQNGTVYWSTAEGSRVGLPAIETLYASSGGAGGVLGARLSGLISIPQNGGGFAQSFAGGSVYVGNGLSAFAVSGAIRENYFGLGGSAGSLGWPTSAMVCNADGSCSQTFQNSTIYWSPSTGGRLGLPAIEAVATTLGSAVLGARQSGLIWIPQNRGGYGQVYATGSIYSSPNYGTYAVLDGIRSYYFTLGGSAAAIGWPIGAQSCGADGVCTQRFQGGTIVWSAAAGGKLQ